MHQGHWKRWPLLHSGGSRKSSQAQIDEQSRCRGLSRRPRFFRIVQRLFCRRRSPPRCRISTDPAVSTSQSRVRSSTEPNFLSQSTPDCRSKKVLVPKPRLLATFALKPANVGGLPIRATPGGHRSAAAYSAIVRPSSHLFRMDRAPSTARQSTQDFVGASLRSQTA